MNKMAIDDVFSRSLSKILFQIACCLQKWRGLLDEQKKQIRAGVEGLVKKMQEIQVEERVKHRQQPFCRVLELISSLLYQHDPS